MLDFISQNIANILIGAGILTVIVLIVVNLIKGKKNGKSAGCGCDGCASSSAHHHKH